MTSVRHMVRSSAVFSVGMLFENFCSTVLGFFVARLLGPTIQGLWQTARLFRTYSDLAGLGQALGMRREAAVALGAGDEEEVARQRDTSFAWNTFSLLGAGVVLAVYALLAPLSTLMCRALLAVAATVAVTGASNFFNLWYKTVSRFGVLAAASVAGGVANLLAIGLLYWLGFSGLLVGYVATAVTILVVLVLFYGERLRLRFSVGAWRRSLSIGFPLFLITASGMVFASVDRILVIALMGFANMGFYSVAAMCFVPLQMAVSSVAVVLLPHVCRQYGANGSAAALGKYLLMPLSVLMIGLPALTGFLAILLPPVVRLLLPQYEAGIVPAQVTLVGLSFAAAGGFSHNILQAAGRTWWLFGAMLAGSVVKLILVWVFIRGGWGLVGVSAASAGAYIVQFLLLFMLGAAVARVPLRACARFVGEAVVSALFCVALWCHIGDISVLWRGPVAGTPVTRYLALLGLALPAAAAAARAMRLLRGDLAPAGSS